MKIPKIIHQIWVGDKSAPLKWMRTWQEKNPDWKYVLWNNEKILNFNFINKNHIKYYWDRKIWHGVADVARYEILYNYGGLMPGADSECLLPIDDIFKNNYDLFAVRCGAEPEDWARVDGKKDKILPAFLLGDELLSGLGADKKKAIAPIYACSQRNKFIKKLISELSKVKKLEQPWKTTGNRFCTEMILKHKPRIKIFPMHYFMPYHPPTRYGESEYHYIGKDKVYATHKWGSTLNTYNKGI